MDISSFLVVIVFCFLLFMENETEAEAARNKLGLALGHLYRNLEDLRDNIRPDAREIDKRIDRSMRLIDDVRAQIRAARPRNARKIKETIGMVPSIPRSASSLSTEEWNKFFDWIERLCKQISIALHS
jgi:hypothetical protein